MFRLTNHHQGAYSCVLLRLCLLKWTVKIRRYEFSVVVWLRNYPVLLVCVCAVRGAFCTVNSTHTYQ